MGDWTADRRTALKLLATTGLTAGLTGCSGDGETSEDTTESGDGTATSTGSGDDMPDGENTLQSGFEQLWEAELPSSSGSPDFYTAAAGTGFLGVGFGSRMYGVQTSDGSVLWDYSDGGDIDAAAVTDTHVFFHHSARTGPGTVVAVNQDSGEVDEKRQGSSDRLPMVALPNHVIVPWETQDLADALYVLTTDGGLDGPLTETEGTQWVDGEGEYAVVGFRDTGGATEVVGYDLGGEQTSEKIWEIPDLQVYDTTVVDGTLVAPNDDAFTLLDIETGDRTDISVETGLSSRDIVTAGGLAVHRYRNERLYAVDPAAGEVAWTVEDDLSDYTRMVSIGDAVVLWGPDNLLAVDPATGEFIAGGGDPPDDTEIITANEQAVYSCGETVVAHDAEF